MASKNNHRYQIRKRMNAIKHEPKSLFDTQPVFISSWQGLDGLENDKYKIELDDDGYSGWIHPKFDIAEKDYYYYNHYLSTHTFYEHTYFDTTVLLRRLGFNVQLKNWDGETVYCKY